jgi:hypothetical protein
MTPPDLQTPSVDASALCRACGICCGWTLFATVGLRPDEIDWALRRRLPIVQQGEKVSFSLPCSVLATTQAARQSAARSIASCSTATAMVGSSWERLSAW